MAARRTAAAAVVADFRAELARHPLTRQPDGSWAYQLANEVESLLQVAGYQETALDNCTAALARSMAIYNRDAATLCQALADAIAYREPSGTVPAVMSTRQGCARTTPAT
jgi:hypothetical protein